MQKKFPKVESLKQIKENKLSTNNGVVNLPTKEGTEWVAYNKETFFDFFGCTPLEKLLELRNVVYFSVLNKTSSQIVIRRILLMGKGTFWCSVSRIQYPVIKKNENSL